MVIRKGLPLVTGLGVLKTVTHQEVSEEEFGRAPNLQPRSNFAQLPANGPADPNSMC
jgi:hypothetical protein